MYIICCKYVFIFKWPGLVSWFRIRLLLLTITYAVIKIQILQFLWGMFIFWTLSSWKCYLSFQHFSWFSLNYPLITEKGIQTSRHNCEFQLPWMLGLVLCMLELYLSLNVYTHRNSGFIVFACLFEKNTTFKTWAYVL